MDFPSQWLLVARWALAATVILTLLYRARLKASWPWVFREVTLVTACYLLYFFVRGITAGDEAAALANADKLVDLEKNLGLFQEDQVQSLIVDHGWSITLANWTYVWGHWPFILIVACWLLLNHPHAYAITRNGFLLSGAVGLVIFAIFPVAPPRLMELGLAECCSHRRSSISLRLCRAFISAGTC